MRHCPAPDISLGGEEPVLLGPRPGKARQAKPGLERPSQPKPARPAQARQVEASPGTASQEQPASQASQGKLKNSQARAAKCLREGVGANCVPNVRGKVVVAIPGVINHWGPERLLICVLKEHLSNVRGKGPNVRRKGIINQAHYAALPPRT